MILIADSGRTKMEWCVLDGANVVKHTITPSINTMIVTEEEMSQFFTDVVKPCFEGLQIDYVYFYGAGCLGGEINARVARALMNIVEDNTVVEVNSDLLGAARALCAREPGIACILGTGSNSCLYDGAEITEHVSPLGYVLGDEGSGAVLGRLLLGNVLKKQFPEYLCEAFHREYQLDTKEILQRVYHEPLPNAFLASVSRFLLNYIEEPAVHRLVLNEFKAFFVRNVVHYTGYKDLPVNFVGSIAYNYLDVLQEAAAAVDCNLGKVTASPMEGLIAYHTQA